MLFYDKPAVLNPQISIITSLKIEEEIEEIKKK
jgi:hypothetical protein